MTKQTNTISVYTSQAKKPIASIVLNGYNIAAGGPLGRTGAMRSFKVISGDLWDSWNRQETLSLQSDNGEQATIKIAALPVEIDGAGLVEFL